MADGYESHADFMAGLAEPAAERQKTIELALQEAFSTFIDQRPVETIAFARMADEELAQVLIKYPLLLKPLIALCNVAARAIERDIGIKNLNTYMPVLTRMQAARLAAYIRPLLPPSLEIPTISYLDRTQFTDKEIRAGKGRWERLVRNALTSQAVEPFAKRRFVVTGEPFELDAASPVTGAIEIGVDVKRIEARREIHKRCDEIVRKAVKLREVYPGARFAAVVYYPFVDEQGGIARRLSDPAVDVVVFASQAPETVKAAARSILVRFGRLATA